VMQFGDGFRILKHKNSREADGAESTQVEEMAVRENVWSHAVEHGSSGDLVVGLAGSNACPSGSRRMTETECLAVRWEKGGVGPIAAQIIKNSKKPAGCFESNDGQQSLIYYNRATKNPPGKMKIKPICKPAAPAPAPITPPPPSTPAPPPPNSMPVFVNCGEEYVRLVGDIVGWGEIATKEGGYAVSDCTVCRDWCNGLQECGSYECSARQKRCNLNLGAYPQDYVPQYEDYAFCQKLARTTDSSANTKPTARRTTPAV